MKQYQKVVALYKSGNFDAAASAAGDTTSVMMTLQGEMQAAGVHVSP